MKCLFCHNLTICPSKVSNLINIMIFQVVVVAGFTPVEEVEEERVVRDFCREGSVGDQRITKSMVGLAEEVELGEGG